MFTATQRANQPDIVDPRNMHGLKHVYTTALHMASARTYAHALSAFCEIVILSPSDRAIPCVFARILTCPEISAVPSDRVV